MSRPRLIALLLALGTLLVFLPVGQFGFINFDDPDYIAENSFVKNGLTGTDLHWAFTTFHACNWHPLTWISLMADCTLFGLNAGASHFVNVLLHAANAALLFLLLWRLTEKIWPAAFVAALFAWHPLHIESVAWISERKDVLSLFFGLLTLLNYTRYAQAGAGGGWRVKSLFSPVTEAPSLYPAVAFFALGLMAKQMLVTLPLVMLLLDFWPLRRVTAATWSPATLGRLVAEKTPFFLLVLPTCVVTCLAQHPAMSSLERLPFGLRLENSLVTYGLYLLKLFWPVNLALFYPLAQPSPARLAAAGSALLAMSVFAVRARHRFPYVAVGWLWFLGTLVPVIGLVQVGEQAMADRYAYLPSIGIFILIAYGSYDLAGRYPFAKTISGPAAILILAGCVLATKVQLRYWRTDETLFFRALAVTRNNEIAHINLGVVYEKQGRNDAAMNEYRQALAINPHRANTHNNIGDLLDEAGHPTEALAEYEAALQLKPDGLETHLNLGSVLVELQRFDEAAAHFQRAAELKPADARPHYEMGRALLKQGRDAAALDEFRQTLQREPDNGKILAFTARVLAADENAAGRNGRAALDFASHAHELYGDSLPMALDALGMACAETGDFTNAQLYAQKVLDLAVAAQMPDTGGLQRRLELYRNGQPWRESFQAPHALKR